MTAKIRRFGVVLAGLLLSGCVAMHKEAAPLMSSQEYQARPPLEASLFPSDQAVLGDEAIKRILSSKVELPGKAKVAVMKFLLGDGAAARYYGYCYWRQEEYVKTQQESCGPGWFSWRIAREKQLSTCGTCAASNCLFRPDGDLASICSIS